MNINDKQILWSYRLPTFIVFSSFIYVFMVGVGFTKMKKGKQLAMLTIGMFIADSFIQRKKASDIFYDIPPIQHNNNKELQIKRKQLINQSIILDSKIYEIEKQKDYESKQLIEQAKVEQDQIMKKALLEAAGYKVIDKKDIVL